MLSIKHHPGITSTHDSKDINKHCPHPEQQWGAYSKHLSSELTLIQRDLYIPMQLLDFVMEKLVALVLAL